jgi:ribonuclease T2
VPVGPLIAAMAKPATIGVLTALPLLALLFSFSEESGPVTNAGQATLPVSPASASELPLGKGFDFYVLALSWSPAYCLAEGAGANRQQCDPDRDLAFVVHGLWPQNETGYPEFCSSREPERVPSQLGRDYLDLLPSMGLIGHQWRKHGSCSGLTQRDYFDVTRAARQRISIRTNSRLKTCPARSTQLRPRMPSLRPIRGLSHDAIAVKCERGMLREIRICMTSTLDFRGCREVDSKGCTLDNLEVPEPG